MSKGANIAANLSGFVEVLTTQVTGKPFGYRLQGGSSGPQLVVAGVCDMTDEVFDRIMRIPTLPWMRGSLVLIRLNALDDLFTDLARLNPLGTVDRTLVLPWPDDKVLNAFVLRRNYHLILRTCSDLGMIAGRGVARPTTGES